MATAILIKLNFVLLDGSVGFHNPVKAEELIGEARRLVETAAKIK